MLAAAVQITRSLVVGAAHIIAAVAASRFRPIQTAPKPSRIVQAPRQSAPSKGDTDVRINSLCNTITAELELADAARSKAQTEQDPYKRAQWYKRTQDAENRADKAQSKIDKLRQSRT